MKEIVREVAGRTLRFTNIAADALPGQFDVDWDHLSGERIDTPHIIAMAEMMLEVCGAPPRLMTFDEAPVVVVREPLPCPDCAAREAHRALMAEQEDTEAHRYTAMDIEGRLMRGGVRP